MAILWGLNVNVDLVVLCSTPSVCTAGNAIGDHTCVTCESVVWKISRGLIAACCRWVWELGI